MNIQSVPWIKLLLTLLAILAIWWIYNKKMEWYETTEVKYFSKAAHRNPLLASSRLLEKFGYESKNLINVAEFTLANVSVDDVIWIMNADAVTDAKTIETLSSWVFSGGHLILGIEDPLSPSWESALQQFSIKINSEAISETDSIVTFLPEQSDDAITVQFEPGINLYPSGDYTQGIKRTEIDQDGERPFAIVQVEKGSGIFTLLADATIFDNHRLKDYDNASMLIQLLTARSENNINYFTGQRYVPGLLGTLWQNFPVTIISLCIALAAWIFYAAARLGPIRQELEPGRTNLISHLRARGHFWRRRRDLSPLSDPVKQDVLRQIKKNYRLSNTDDHLPNHVIQNISQLAGVSEQQIRRVLSDQSYSVNELPNAAILLQRILNTHLPRSQNSTRFSP